ncbi:hypothetical protein [Actinomadura hibisca]|uniref:hypothetical protein n=1 Tax=Actinomadura hibisca TaxID=68565 RepID=UPI000833FF6C|nr:hypothetical protein [Actinomadura hibisca]
MRLTKHVKAIAIGAGATGLLSAAGALVLTGPPPTAQADKPPQNTNMVLSLPLDAYQLSAQQHAEQVNAENIVTRACMKSFGISYLADTPDITSRFLAGTAAADSRRYGISDAVSAKERGYHLPPAMRSTEETSTRAAGDDQLTSEQKQVLTGQAPVDTNRRAEVRLLAIKEYQGKTVPEGGCIGETSRALRLSGSNQVSQKTVMLAATLQRQAYLKTQSHPTTVAVFHKWSACMAEQGFRYANPIKAATDPAWELDKAITPREVQTAVADVACKQRTDLVKIEHGVEVALQQAAIKKHAAELTPLKEAVAEQVTALRDAKDRYGS